MKFSIIVLGYNQEDAICATLHDALSQTYENIEVIYVDDCSTDSSVARVKEQIRDPRLTIIQNSRNSGPFVGRLNGIEAAAGDYLLLLDGDDSLAPDACAVLADVLQGRPDLDLVGFGIEMIADGAVDRTYLQKMEQSYSLPLLGDHSGEALCRGIFIDRTIPTTVNKCYSAKLAKAVAGYAVQDRLYYNEDFYFTFMACTLAKHYHGIGKKFYRYRIGHGISTARKPSFDSYARSLSACNANRHCTQFAIETGVYETYRSVLAENLKNNLLGAYYKLVTLPAEQKAKAAKLLFDTYGTEYTISTLAGEFWYDRRSVAPHLCLGELFPFRREGIRTVAMFYHRLYGGGAERVTALLTHILHKMGYQTVVITNEPPNPDDFPLPEETVRLSLGAPEEGADYAARFRTWQQYIEQYGIDAVICHAWLDDSLLWDLCAVKSTGAAFITYNHTVCIAGLYNGWTGVSDVRSTLAYADGIVTLTESDRLYWSQVNKNVHCVTNPMTFHVADMPAAPLTGHNILWLSRFDYAEKNPEDPLHIMQRVLRYVPDATLTMVGGMDDALRRHFEVLIRDMGLEGHVILPGFTTDIAPYYQRASVHLMTPNYESYSMTISESLANGVPVVTYELPYLTRVNRSRAIVQVPWRDTAVAAEVIVELLIDEQRRREMGAYGRQETLQLEQYDFAAAWAEILRSVETGSGNPTPIPDHAHTELIAAFDLVTRQMCHKQQHQHRELAALYNAPTGLRKIVRKSKTAVRVLKENGIGGLLKVTKEKLK